MYLLNFLDGFDRLVAFDARRLAAPLRRVHSQAAFCLESPGIIIEVGFVEMLRKGEGWRKGDAWSSRVARMDHHPLGHQDPPDSARRPQQCSTVPAILPSVKDWSEVAIVAHATTTSEFSSTTVRPVRVIQWGRERLR